MSVGCQIVCCQWVIFHVFDELSSVLGIGLTGNDCKNNAEVKIENLVFFRLPESPYNTVQGVYKSHRGNSTLTLFVLGSKERNN